MADDDDITPPGGEWPPSEEHAPEGEGGSPTPAEDEDEGARWGEQESTLREEDTLPAEDRSQRDHDEEDSGQADEGDGLPPTGVHEVVFRDEADEERLAEQIPSFEEYRRLREAGASGQGAGGETDSEDVSEGEPSAEEAERVSGAGEADEMPDGDAEGHPGDTRGDTGLHDDAVDGGDTLDGAEPLEGVSLPEDDEADGFAGEHGYEEELAREAADVFPTGYEHTAEEIHRRRLEAHRRHRRNGRIRLLIMIAALALIVFVVVHEAGGGSAPPKPPPKGPITPTSTVSGKGFLQKGLAADALPGNLLISDWGSRKLLVISPKGQIVWQYQQTSPVLKPFNPDYAFFTPSGKQIVISEEGNSRIDVLTVKDKQIVYHYGHYGQQGASKNYLRDPSNALEEGSEIVISDQRNCRVIAVTPPFHTVVKSIGRTGLCKHAPPRELDSPASAFPMSDGGTVITETGAAHVDLLDAAGKLTRSFKVPGFKLPESVNETDTGDLVAVDHMHPGAVEIFTTTGKVLWRYRVRSGAGELRDPAVAYVLPDNNVIVSDEYHDRVIVIDRKTKKIIWQYGRTGVPGGGNGYLDVPVGLDFVSPHSLLDHYPAAKPPR
ncbi:MAG TPA: PQQ-binding-like beta-propeller repeat protein [Solirubrobacteraceae bacterium]|nr:PQQ-binding-like beta-propeller repeat protein [Solirubrobacteraceae bacterium]